VRLSVLVVSFNCRALLDDCLRSLEAERSQLDLEVIVVDNRSTDGTLEHLRRSYPWVRAVDAGGNLGFSAANNIGLPLTTGEHVLLLNPDTVVPPGALAAAVQRLEAEPSLGMLGVKLVQPDGTLDHACKRGFPTPAASLFYLVGLARLRPHSRRFAAYTAGHIGADEESRVDAVNGAFMLMRREALDAVGPLDERFWMYGEDLDWCLRFWQAGWPVLYWPREHVLHVKGGSSSKRRAWRTNLAFHQAMWLFYTKHYRQRHARWVTATVFTGIWTRLAVTAAQSWVLRSLPSATR
jgi:GT2 family glycosyltransferase